MEIRFEKLGFRGLFVFVFFDFLGMGRGFRGRRGFCVVRFAVLDFRFVSEVVVILFFVMVVVFAWVRVGRSGEFLCGWRFLRRVSFEVVDFFGFLESGLDFSGDLVDFRFLVLDF